VQIILVYFFSEYINLYKEFMIVIDGHTLDENLIDKGGWILDLGSLNFNFACRVNQYCKNILSFDPNPVIKYYPNKIKFYNKAVTSDYSGIKEFFIYKNDTSASFYDTNKHDTVREIVFVHCISIPDIMKQFNIKQFELIKIDIEGSEYEILQNIDLTISKQFSIEFHDCYGMNNLGTSWHKNFKHKVEQYFDTSTYDIYDMSKLSDVHLVLKKDYWR